MGYVHNGVTYDTAEDVTRAAIADYVYADGVFSTEEVADGDAQEVVEEMLEDLDLPHLDQAFREYLDRMESEYPGQGTPIPGHDRGWFACLLIQDVLDEASRKIHGENQLR